MTSEDFWIYVQHPRWRRCGGRFGGTGRAFCCGRLVGFSDYTGFEGRPIHFAKIKVAQSVDGSRELGTSGLKSGSAGEACTRVLRALGQRLANGFQTRTNYKII